MQGMLALVRCARRRPASFPGFRASDPDARDRIMHEFRVEISDCSFSE
jgi:hypothetical protein